MIDRLQTEIQIQPNKRSIRYPDRILLFGSCFADEIGERMKNAGFSLMKNPMGTLYNPASINSTIQRIAQRLSFTENEIFCREGIYSSFSHHGSFYDLSPDGFLEQANRKLLNAHEYLTQTDIVIITLGTARVYRLRRNGNVVVNCHKFPKDTFSEDVLTVEDCCREMENAMTAIREISRKKVQFIFTVSPIRHIRDGLHDNRISKSILLLATELLCSRHEDCSYYPSYEIMEDELRDYRFYAEDLCHPSGAAVEYIWKRFMDFSMTEETKGLVREVENLRRSQHHRILFPESEAGRKFKARLEEQLKDFHEKHPEVIL